MAKVCSKCGRKISFGQKSVELAYSQINFCQDCGREINELLMPVRILSDTGKLQKVKADFKARLESSPYEKEIKNYLRDEFEYIVADHVEDSQVVVKRFRADFQDCYDKIFELGSEFAVALFQPQIIEAGDAKVTTFVFDIYPTFGNRIYLSLTVNLVYYKGITTVTTIGSGDGDEAFSDSAIYVVTDFWKEMRKKYGRWMDLTIDEEAAEYEESSADSISPSHGVTPEKRVLGGIGLLGGTFDPVHNGHVALGEAAIRELALKKLIVMPARVQPFKAGKRVTEDYHREAMAKLAFEGNDKVEVSDYELNNIGISYTYQTLRYIRETYADDKIYFILGADSFMELESWYRGVELLERYAFAVSVRPDYEESALNESIERYRDKYGTEIVKIHSKMPDVSSTEIRDRLSSGQSASDLLPESVERYIEKNGLYR